MLQLQIKIYVPAAATQTAAEVGNGYAHTMTHRTPSVGSGMRLARAQPRYDEGRPLKVMNHRPCPGIGEVEAPVVAVVANLRPHLRVPVY